MPENEEFSKLGIDPTWHPHLLAELYEKYPAIFYEILGVVVVRNALKNVSE